MNTDPNTPGDTPEPSAPPVDPATLAAHCRRNFVALLGCGCDPAEAFGIVFNCLPGEAERGGPALLARPDVQREMKAFQRECARRLEKLGLDRERLLLFLSRVMDTPPSQVSADSWLAQACVIKTTAKGTDTVTSVRMPDKLQAAELICFICGFYENGPRMPERIVFMRPPEGEPQPSAA